MQAFNTCSEAKVKLLGYKNGFVNVPYNPSPHFSAVFFPWSLFMVFMFCLGITGILKKLPKISFDQRQGQY